MDLLRVQVDSSFEWEVPGDTPDAVGSSDEEKSVATTFNAFLLAAGKAKPKGRPTRRATTTHPRGHTISVFAK